MENFDVYVWTETHCGYSDHSRNVNAEDYEGALNTAMSELGLEEAHTTQIFKIGDCGPEDQATHFDDVTKGENGKYSGEKWHW